MSIDYTDFSNTDMYDDSKNDSYVIEKEISEKNDVMGKIYNTQKVYVRSAPEVVEGNDLTVLDKGADILVSDISDGWCKVCTETGIEGYVMEKFVKTE